MTKGGVDKGRRRFLTATVSVVGGVGMAAASIPFVASWLPSAKAQSLGAPVEVDVSKIEPGQKLTVAWRGQPIFVVNRPSSVLNELERMQNILRDPHSIEKMQPKYAENPTRSIKENILVVVGICTHLGCVPVFRPEVGSLDADWQGGFFCPCHGSKYDMAGRVYKGMPAPTNLPVPPHKYVSDNMLLIGEETA